MIIFAKTEYSINKTGLLLALQSGLVINNVEDDHQYLCNTNKLESFSNIVGMSPVVRQPVVTYLGLRLTALAVTVVNQFTVAFVGTEDGRLKKVIYSVTKK